MNIDGLVLKKSDYTSSGLLYFFTESSVEESLDPLFLEKNADFDVAAYCKQKKFTGASGSSLQFPYVVSKKQIVDVFFMGLGKDQKGVWNIETLRRAIGSAIKAAKAKKITTIDIFLPHSSLFDYKSVDFIQDMYTIASMAAYRFDHYISKKEKTSTTFSFRLIVSQKDHKGIEEGAKRGAIIAEAVNGTRTMNDTPPSDLTPKDLAHVAERLADKHGLKCTIFDGKKIKSLKMGGLHGVSRGSSEDPRFVILEYKAKKAKAKTIAFVGKGITFDSGGLSIKPANSMETMKDDMAGASAVIHTLAALAQLKPDVHVIGIAPITENMPGCSALKPGDIVTFYNGKTAEVRNTDAEGRLILADALSYVTKEYELDAVIDVATLTGACIYAVGPFYSALLSDNDELAQKIEESALCSGDAVWRLPFNDDFKTAIRSDIADMQNIGDTRIAAGTITAACFLREFTGDVPWAHLDIASSAFGVPNISYFDKGATGSSVRLLIDIACHWK